MLFLSCCCCLAPGAGSTLQVGPAPPGLNQGTGGAPTRPCLALWPSGRGEGCGRVGFRWRRGTRWGVPRRVTKPGRGRGRVRPRLSADGRASPRLAPPGPLRGPHPQPFQMQVRACPLACPPSAVMCLDPLCCPGVWLSVAGCTLQKAAREMDWQGQDYHVGVRLLSRLRIWSVIGTWRFGCWCVGGLRAAATTGSAVDGAGGGLQRVREWRRQTLLLTESAAAYSVYLCDCWFVWCGVAGPLGCSGQPSCWSSQTSTWSFWMRYKGRLPVSVPASCAFDQRSSATTGSARDGVWRRPTACTILLRVRHRHRAAGGEAQPALPFCMSTACGLE